MELYYNKLSDEDRKKAAYLISAERSKAVTLSLARGMYLYKALAAKLAEVQWQTIHSMVKRERISVHHIGRAGVKTRPQINLLELAYLYKWKINKLDEVVSMILKNLIEDTFDDLHCLVVHPIHTDTTF